MGKKSRTRSGQASGTGKGSRTRNLRSSTNPQPATATTSKSPARSRPAESLSPATNNQGLTRSRRRDQEESSSSSDDVASEIIVRTDGMDDAMELDTSASELASPSPGPAPESDQSSELSEPPSLYSDPDLDLNATPQEAFEEPPEQFTESAPEDLPDTVPEVVERPSAQVGESAPEEDPTEAEPEELDGPSEHVGESTSEEAFPEGTIQGVLEEPPEKVAESTPEEALSEVTDREVLEELPEQVPSGPAGRSPETGHQELIENLPEMIDEEVLEQAPLEQTIEEAEHDLRQDSSAPSHIPRLVESAENPEPQASFSSSLSSLSDQSDLSSVPHSSKATTPVDLDSSADTADLPPAAAATPATDAIPSAAPLPVPFTITTSDAPRRRYDVRPRVSIPSDLQAAEYAMQCVTAAESSRLNPYALHPEEYVMLRDHISPFQVTNYLNLRNGILRLWIRNVQIAVTREEAIGCAKDSRWFDVASLCFDWLVRRGYINFGCVEVRGGRKVVDTPADLKRRRIVVIGAGMSGLGCARQLEGLFTQYRQTLRSKGEDIPEVVVLEGRDRIGGRVYSRSMKMQRADMENFAGHRCTAEMGGMIITGFDRGNPMNVLVRGQLALHYHNLRPETTIYDSNGKPVDEERDQLMEKLYNDLLARVSEYKFKNPSVKLIEGNRELMEEGRDSSAESTKTIQQLEEEKALQPHAPPVSEQNLVPHVDLVPVSSDRATGKIHTEPGTAAAQKAAHQARSLGWALKEGVSEDDDIDLTPGVKEPNATLGSVTDYGFSEYKKLLDLTPQDYRLFNWHIANLEYSNAINYKNLSLPGWDIDAGNEWEGKHSMVVGGYQTVPQGLMLCPQPLNVRTRSAVKKIAYSLDKAEGQMAVVECEDGHKVKADYVVNTIPLGVLKHGSIEFDPPLPDWKSEAIQRLGYGVLNKVILVFKEPFWDIDRDIFGVLRTPANRNSLSQGDYEASRGRFFQWFNITEPSGLPTLLALMAGDAGLATESTPNDILVNEAIEVLRSVFGQGVSYPVEAIVTRWASDKFARGSYSSAGPNMRADDYDTMARPLGNLYFAGEHTLGTHPATVHGAYMSGLRAASNVIDEILGPLEIPVPLIAPRDSLKRKAPDTKDPAQARQEAYENKMWDSIVAQIGTQPLKPVKPATNAYMFYTKANQEEAKKRCEVRRRPGKGKASGNEVRNMCSKMWKEATPEERAPYEAMAAEKKQAYQQATDSWAKLHAEWHQQASKLSAAYQQEHPNMPTPEELAAEENRSRRSKMRVDSYAEPDESDVDIA